MVKEVIEQVIGDFSLDPIVINSGYCYGFAVELNALLYLKNKSSDIVNNEHFFVTDKEGFNLGWDKDEFAKYNLPVPSFNSRDIDENYHVFIYFEGMFYDAECSEGTVNWLDLPFYQRVLNK